ncbi:MAG: cytochrome c biogenesis protein [Verrucomicrobiae bacterium]|nr:cytochrome c biogenesis protein [Verrucomicrobiae bacterium]
MTERLLLWFALLGYGAASVVILRRLRRAVPSDLAGVLIALAFALHTVALWWRGHQLHRCPVANPFEVQVFIAWSAVLFYLVVGPAYRVSFLGAFTAPLVFVMLGAAVMLPVDVRAGNPDWRGPWVEAHAAVGIVACGALALACVIGAMYLLQERQLKSRRPARQLWLMPALDQLDLIGFRLLIVGFVLLSVGMVGGVISQRVATPWPWPKTAWAVAVWCLYGVLMIGRALHLWCARKAALGAVGGFVFTVGAYCWANWLVR